MEIKDSFLQIDVLEILRNLSDEGKQEVLELFTWNLVLPMIEKQLAGDTHFWGFSTNGNRSNDKVRERLLSIQGIEPEFKKDLESKINAHKRDAEHYKKYYDWYFSLYHADRELFDKAVNLIGDAK